MQLSNQFDICFVFLLSMSREFLMTKRWKIWFDQARYIRRFRCTIISEFSSFINLADAFSFHTSKYDTYRKCYPHRVNMQLFYKNKVTTFHPQRILYCFSPFDCRQKPLLSNIPSILMILVHTTLNRNNTMRKDMKLNFG